MPILAPDTFQNKFIKISVDLRWLFTWLMSFIPFTRWYFFVKKFIFLLKRLQWNNENFAKMKIMKRKWKFQSFRSCQWYSRTNWLISTVLNYNIINGPAIHTTNQNVYKLSGSLSRAEIQQDIRLKRKPSRLHKNEAKITKLSCIYKPNYQ